MRYAKGFCAKGHELIGAHVYVDPQGKKRCYTCIKARRQRTRDGVTETRCCDNCGVTMPAAKGKGFCSGCVTYRADLARLRSYKLDRFQFDAMYFEQDGACAVCHEAEATHVDHDHHCCPGQMTCGRCVRALLCSGCNKGLGHFGDRAELLQAASDYLMEHNG